MAVLAALIATPAQAGSWSKPVPLFELSEQRPRGPAVDWNEKGGLVALANTNIPQRLVAAFAPGTGRPFSTPPQVIAGQTQSYDVAADPAGLAVAVFSYAEGLEPGVYYAVRPRGAAFGSRIERLHDENAGVSLHVSPAGETLAVSHLVHCPVRGTTCEGSDLHVAVKPPGASAFGPPQQVSVQGGHVAEPVVRFDARGNAVIAWLDHPTQPQTHVAYALRPAGGGFGQQRDLGVDGPGHHTGAVRLDSNRRGDLVAAWQEYPPGEDGPLVQAATGSVAGGLGEPVTLSGRPASGPRAVVDAAGGRIVAWREGPPGRRRIVYRQATPAGEFLPRRTIVRGRGLSLPTAIGGRRGWSVLWRTGGTAFDGSAHGQSLHVASLAPPRLSPRIQTFSRRSVEGHVLLQTTRLEAVVAWSLFQPDRINAVYAASGRAGVGFGAPRRIASTPTGSGLIAIPRLFGGPDGRAFAVWHEGTAKDDRIGVTGAYYSP
jgi:hypothetical protein